MPTTNRTGDVIAVRRTLHHQALRRTYTEVRSTRTHPGAALVIVLHGAFQTGNALRRFSNRAFDRFADGGAVVVYPDARRREWNGARAATMLFKSAKTVDDVGFLRTLIADCAARHGIATDRVYLIGFSLGGQVAIRMLHDAPESLTSVALISATLPGPGNLVVAAGRDDPVPVPVVAIHGTADPLTPYRGGHVSLRGRFSKGPHLSAPGTAGYFARRNGIDTEPVVHHLKPVPPTAPGQVTRADYPNAAAPVTLYTVVGGEHEIPGASSPKWQWLRRRARAEFDAVAAVAEFFRLPYPTPTSPR
ncbi:alpha/beta hydrolase family esterase [Nocardia farcinica]|uniref:alpha/beta hydrolase family esterase n=1 Tax=Nocardia farcinica TaxID=37329 RepID=UPI0024570BC5|nr:alpha/beta fold hydrolase [Nocardia farcinica]